MRDAMADIVVGREVLFELVGYLSHLVFREEWFKRFGSMNVLLYGIKALGKIINGHRSISSCNESPCVGDPVLRREALCKERDSCVKLSDMVVQHYAQVLYV